MAGDKETIAGLLKQYQDALKASSTYDVMNLYAPEGAFMSQHFQTAVGIEEVRKAYDMTFNIITLSVGFNIIEIVPINTEWVFARTASAGTVKVKAGGGGPEANQELFVMQKVDGIWKIARY